MKKIVTTALITCATMALIAQNTSDPVIEEGALFKVDKRSVPSRFVGFDDTGIYIEYAQGKFGQGDLLLQKFNHDLTPSKTLPLDFNVGGGYTADSWLLFKIDDKIYSCAKSGIVDFKDFYLQEINPLTLEKKTPIKIATVKPETKSAANVTSRFAFSPDSSYLSFIYSIPTKRTESERFGVKMFDRTLSKLWEAEYDFPYQNKLLDPQKYLVNQDGDMFILAKRYVDKRKEKVDGQANYDFILFEMKKDGTLDSVLMQSEGKFLRGMNVAFAPDGDIITGGFYSDLSNYSAGGAFYMRLNGDSRKVSASAFKAFDTDFFTANLTERKAERVEKKIEEGKDVELPFYHIDEFITAPDGSLQMIGEKRLISTVTTCTPYGCVTTYHFYYDDIALVQISAEGQIDWATRIAKKQHTVNDNAMLSSYATLVRPTETVLFFNDNAKNEIYDGVGRVSAMAKGTENTLMMVRVDESGNMTRKSLMKQGEADIRFRPAFSQQLNANEILIFGHQGVKTQRFFKVKFKSETM